MLKKLMLTSLVGAFFIYGLAVGIYKIFPFYEIQTLKKIIVGTNELDYVNPYYLDRTSFFKLNSRSDYDVVFIGDSITDLADWHDLFPALTVANRGISKDTTAGVLNRMDTIVSTKAEKAFLMIGTNDIGKDIDPNVTINNYNKIIDELKNNNIEPVVLSVLYTYKDPKRDNKTINSLNVSLKQLCSKLGVTYVDLNAYLSKDGSLDRRYSNDGLHLNGAGYAVWVEVVQEYMPK